MTTLEEPRPFSLEEYLAIIKKHTHELHELSHDEPEVSPDNVLLIELYRDLVDVLDWLTNSSSWHDGVLRGYDKDLLREELIRKVMWRWSR